MDNLSNEATAALWIRMITLLFITLSAGAVGRLIGIGVAELMKTKSGDQ